MTVLSVAKRAQNGSLFFFIYDGPEGSFVLFYFEVGPTCYCVQSSGEVT